MKRIIIFTGLSATGKSSLAKLLAKEIQAPEISPNDLLEAYAKKSGVQTARALFENKGIEKTRKIRSRLLFSFIQKQKASVVIVDGLYDYALFSQLKKKYAKGVFVVDVTANRSLRKAMVLKRLKGEANVKKYLKQRNEPKLSDGLLKIKREANISIRNNSGLQKTVAHLRAHV